MSKYIVVRNFYEGNGLHEEGNAFEHQNQAYIEKLLADGNIAEVGSEGVPTTPVSEPPADQGAPATPAPLEETSVSNSEQDPQSVQPVVASPAQPQVITPTPAPQQPTQAEIEATLAASEGNSLPSDGVQIS